MNLLQITLVASGLALIACTQSAPPARDARYEGFWLDSSGMAAFEVRKENDSSFVLSNRLGSLRGQRQPDAVRGTTDLGDTFQLQVQGDTAHYQIMGVNLPYYRISKGEFDSIMRLE